MPDVTPKSLQDLDTPTFIAEFRKKIHKMDPLTAMVVGVLVNRVEFEMKRADKAEENMNVLADMKPNDAE